MKFTNHPVYGTLDEVEKDLYKNSDGEIFIRDPKTGEIEPQEEQAEADHAPGWYDPALAD